MENNGKPKFDPIQTQIDIITKSIELYEFQVETETDWLVLLRAKRNLEKEEKKLLDMRTKYSEYFI